MASTIPVLDGKTVSAHFDLTNRVLIVVYRGVLDATATGNLTSWLQSLRDVMAEQEVRGIVFDLRKVVRFKRDNLYSAHEQSTELDRELEGRQLPVALLVGNYYQEQMAKGTLLQAPDADRREIVHNMDAAVAYIGSWYAQR
jgi:hypothetical protein